MDYIHKLYAKADINYELAAQQGHPLIHNLVGDVYKLQTFVEEKQALKWI